MAEQDRERTPAPTAPKRLFKAMDTPAGVQRLCPLKVHLRERKWQGEENAFRDFIIDLKDISIASQKAQVAHMAAIIADLAPGYVYDTVYDVLVPV